jgi:hypothetical protein
MPTCLEKVNDFLVLKMKKYDLSHYRQVGIVDSKKKIEEIREDGSIYCLPG